MSRMKDYIEKLELKLKEYKYDYIIMKVKGKKREKIANTEERGVA